MQLKRLLLLFCVGVIIPSAFIIYLGFSSLRAEKHVREKEVAERLGTSVEVWRGQLEAALQTAMDAHKGWKISAVMDAQDHWVEPFHQSVEFSWPALSARRAARLATIENTESVEKNYLHAADEYNWLAWDLESAPWKAALLLRAAGSFRKAHAWAQAEESLKHIARDFSDVRSQHGIPFGLLVATDLAEVYAASGKTDLAITKALETFTDVERPMWLLSWKDEKIFTHRLHEHLREWDAQMTEAQKLRWQTLARALNARAERIQMLEDWQANDWPRVQTILRAQGRRDLPTLVWPEHDEDLALWMNPEIDPDTGRHGRTQIVWCDRAPIEALWSHSVRGSSAEAGFTAQIQPVSKGTGDGVKCRLNSMVPPLELHLRATGLSGDAYATPRKIITWGIMLLAAVIFSVALAISWKSLQREWDVLWIKARFLDTVSPKIKTPPSITEFIAQKLQLKGYKNSQEAEEYYLLLKEDTLRLKRAVDEVLNFSHIMANRVPYPFIRFDWAPALHQTIERFRQTSLGKGIAIDFTSSLTTCLIEGHEDALARAVLNVLENAVLYSPRDRLEIHVLLHREGDYALLDIVDRGDGISRSEQALVFDRFYRGASAQQESIPGAGLGLFIARYMIQAHHGTLTLQSTLGKGSTLTIRLPLFPGQ